MNKKVTKAEAAYQPYPKGIQWCSRCTMFEPPNSCSKVVGSISANGWCRFWYPKGVEKK